MRNVLFMALIMSSLLLSCNSTSTDEAQEASQALTVEQAVEKSAEFVDKEIVLEGTVAHVCKHGGKKMFLMGENPDVRIKVVPNEKISAFEAELEGSEIVVTGKVVELRIDEAYLANWEAEIKVELETADEDTEHNISEGDPKHDGRHKETGDGKGEGDGNKEKMEEHQDDPYAQVNELRKELKDSGKEYLSFYSIECSEYKLK